MKNIKALRIGFLVVFLLTLIVSDAFCIDPINAPRIGTPDPKAVPTIVKCPVTVKFTASLPAGWKGDSDLELLFAEIDFTPGHQYMACRYGKNNTRCGYLLMPIEPFGSCTVNSDNKSFMCLQKK